MAWSHCYRSAAARLCASNPFHDAHLRSRIARSLRGHPRRCARYVLYRSRSPRDYLRFFASQPICPCSTERHRDLEMRRDPLTVCMPITCSQVTHFPSVARFSVVMRSAVVLYRDLASSCVACRQLFCARRSVWHIITRRAAYWTLDHSLAAVLASSDSFVSNLRRKSTRSAPISRSGAYGARTRNLRRDRAAL